MAVAILINSGDHVMAAVRVLLLVLALLGVAIIAGTVSGAVWYVVARESGVEPPFSACLIPALIVFGALFGWLLGRSPVYPGARELTVGCALFVLLRVLIAVVTDDTTGGEGLFNSIVFAGVLYAAARITQAQRAAPMRLRDDAV